MDLIDRYLAAVGLLLPRGQRADITAELREALLSSREDKESETGHPLTRGEEEDLLRAFGHPLVVAARYGRQQYLVGPELYPVYVFALKILLAIIVVAAVITGVVNAAVGNEQPGAAIATALGILWNGCISIVGALTIIAAVLQYQNIPMKFLTRWSPAELPKLPRRPALRRQTRFDHAGVLIWTTIFILWWTRALPVMIPYITYIPLKAGQRLDIARAPVWDTLFWPVLAVAAAAVVVHGLGLIGRFTRTSRGLEIARQIAVLVVAWIALRAGHWVDVSGVGIPADSLAKISQGVNVGLQVTLIVVIIAAAAASAYDAWRLYQDRSPSA